MNDKKPVNLTPLYMVLGLTGSSLILTGCFLGIILSALSINVNSNILYIFQAIFVISGIADFLILRYAKNKLS